MRLGFRKVAEEAGYCTKKGGEGNSLGGLRRLWVGAGPDGIPETLWVLGGGQTIFY